MAAVLVKRCIRFVRPVPACDLPLRVQFPRVTRLRFM